MATSISSLIRPCLQTYGSLLEELRESVFAHEDAGACVLWEDQLGRLRVWTANIGAHQTGQSSLDYRLRDASHIRQLIVKLLEDLSQTLKDVQNLIAEDNSLDTASDDSVVSFSIDPARELTGLHEELVSIVDSLYQMSVLVRKPARHDFLIDRDPENVAKFNPYDIKHVEGKFPLADRELVSQLGTANTRRRKHLNYLKRHHAKLGKGIEMVTDQSDGTTSEMSRTIATEFHSQDDPRHELDSDAGLSQNLSQTSYSASLSDGEGITIPNPPQDSSNGKPFECPYCFYIITIGSHKKDWQKHVMDDILPYSCIYPDCRFQSKLFSSRHAWYRHLQKLHKLGQTHLEDETLPATSECPLCKEKLVSSNIFERHVARHLQDLALFALPRPDPDDGLGETPNSSGSGGRSSSTDPVDERGSTGDLEQIRSDEPLAISSFPRRGPIIPVEPSGLRTTFEMVIHMQGDQTLTRMVQLDTGSSVDLLSQLVILDLGKDLEPYKGQGIPLDDGEPIRPLGTVTLDWHAMGKPKTYKTTFLVLDAESSKDFDVVLGRNTIGRIGFYKTDDKVWVLSQGSR